MTRPCIGPDLAPKKPNILPPPHACDTHAHVFGPTARYPFSSSRGYTPPESPVESYRAMLDQLGIERAVIVHGGAHGTDNSVTRDGIAWMGDCCRGIAVVDPDITDHALQALAEAGFKGLRLSTMVKGGISTDHIESLAERIEVLNWHIQIHIDRADELIELAPRLRRLPVDVVVDHLARVRGGQGKDHPAFQMLLELLRESGNCWVKLASWYRLSDCGAPYDDMAPLARALIEARPDRVLWGSNWPHPMLYEGRAPNDGELLDQFMQWAGDDATRHQILVDNPAKLYEFL
jgi:predicted TIM-barrel fold metal-dependent hydrolase